MFGKLFGKSKASDSKSDDPSRAPSLSDPATNPNMIRVYDAYGREMFVTKDTWRSSILPDMIKKAWRDPDQLYPILVQALSDGFEKQIGDAIHHLYDTDPEHGRAACLWGIFLLKDGRPKEAERALMGAMDRIGEQGYLLTNLAKVYEAQGASDRADHTLWHALEVDPNQDNAFSWYWAREKDRKGEEAGIDAVRKIATIPSSWRAQLWLARLDLAKRDTTQALALYKDALSRCPKPVPADLLMQMSGDLGNAGQLSDLLRLVEPHFRPEAHGLLVGNNLIKAHLDLSQLDAAQSILDKLYALNRPDYQQNLRFWDTAIAKARTEKVESPKDTSLGMLSVEGPIWLAPGSEGTSLFPTKDTSAISISVIGGTAELAEPSQTIKRQLSDTVGRITRALPLFLAEQIEFRTTAHAITLVPWVTENRGAGFVLSGSPWSGKDIVEHAKRSGSGSRYVMTVHLKSAQEPWSVEVRVLGVQDEKLLADFSSVIDAKHFEATIPQLALRLLDSLANQGLVESAEPPPLYQVPQGRHFGDYLLRLEQLLALRCASMEATQRGFLNNEREIIEGNIGLCVDNPSNLTVRLLLAKSLAALARVRPEIMFEFKPKLAALSRDKPIADPSQKIIEAVIAQAIPQ